ncbi:hypothetical protein BD410DRAFT_780218 [Rickenella mellea]|uniref:Uncharacterized protein n=1 Tax=Rickenella mellea TaxID=50990 RepID=A0A4R5XH37_9AGAM|nr:hypothetical protein BD410DRAFT_780218 [Rickenella mellea]
MVDQLDIRGLDDPSVNEFLSHPDLRQICSFFIGWLFFSSFRSLYHSPFTQYIASRLTLLTVRLFGSKTSNANLPEYPALEAQDSPVTPLEKKARRWVDDMASDIIFPKNDYPALVFTLTLLFGLASIAQFASLLSFSPNSSAAQAACAFVVAWGGMSSRTARLVGLLILGFELKNLGVKLWEKLTLWAAIALGTALVFVSSAIAPGTLREVSIPTVIALCYRRHFLPIALATSVLSIVLDLYCLIRILVLIIPPFLRLRHKIDALKDIRIARAASLLVLDLLTIAPDSVQINILADFIPQSIGALLVIAAYNHRIAAPCVTISVPSIHRTNPPSVVSLRPTISISAHAGRRLARPQSAYSGNSRGDHPFSAGALLRDSTIPTDEWLSAQQSTDGDSVREAVVETAIRLPIYGQEVPPVPKRIMLSPTAPAPTQPTKLKLLPILPNQAQLGRQFEEQDRALNRRSRTGPPQVAITAPSSRVSSALLSPGSINSVFGSDIIRTSSDKVVVDKLKKSRSARSSRYTFLSRRGTESSSSSSSGRSARRSSGASSVTARQLGVNSHSIPVPTPLSIEQLRAARAKRPVTAESRYSVLAPSLTAVLPPQSVRRTRELRLRGPRPLPTPHAGRQGRP